MKAAQDKRPKPVQKSESDGALLGMAWRLSTELIVTVLVGAAIGYGLDFMFGTKPWIMFIGLAFGMAAGIRNVFRIAAKMDAANTAPLGNDIGFDDEDEDDDNI